VISDNKMTTLEGQGLSCSHFVIVNSLCLLLPAGLEFLLSLERLDIRNNKIATLDSVLAALSKCDR
jgi:hypothetical protein